MTLGVRAARAAPLAISMQNAALLTQYREAHACELTRGGVNKRHLSPGIMHFVFHALWVTAGRCSSFMSSVYASHRTCVLVIATPCAAAAAAAGPRSRSLIARGIPVLISHCLTSTYPPPPPHPLLYFYMSRFNFSKGILISSAPGS